MTTEELITYLESQKYYNIKHVPGQGLCGLFNMIYTVGVFINLTEHSHGGRYCFPTRLDAVKALEEWEDQEHPPGPWIKFKGLVEFNNPDYDNNN